MVQPTRPRQPADVISAEPRAISPRAVWLTTVLLLAAALAGAILVAVRYHADASAPRGHVSAVRTPGRPRAASAMSVIMADLPRSSGSLAGEVTAFAVHYARGKALVSVTARITGARPDSVYELTGGDCAGGLADHVWAVGLTNPRGSGNLTGQAQTVSVSHEYYLVLGLMPGPGGRPGPAVRGFLATAHGLTAVHGGIAPCDPAAEP